MRSICFQFLPELANEARMTISNLVSMMKHAYGENVLQLFSTEAIERMKAISGVRKRNGNWPLR